MLSAWLQPFFMSPWVSLICQTCTLDLVCKEQLLLWGSKWSSTVAWQVLWRSVRIWIVNQFNDNYSHILWICNCKETEKEGNLTWSVFEFSYSMHCYNMLTLHKALKTTYKHVKFCSHIHTQCCTLTGDHQLIQVLWPIFISELTQDWSGCGWVQDLHWVTTWTNDSLLSFRPIGTQYVRIQIKIDMFFFSIKCIWEYSLHNENHFDGLVQERCNSSALAMELCLSCTNTLVLCPQWVSLICQTCTLGLLCEVRAPSQYKGCLSRYEEAHVKDKMSVKPCYL